MITTEHYPAGEHIALVRVGEDEDTRERSRNFLLRLFEEGTTPEKIWYHLMDLAGRPARARVLWTSEQRPEALCMPP